MPVPSTPPMPPPMPLPMPMPIVIVPAALSVAARRAAVLAKLAAAEIAVGLAYVIGVDGNARPAAGAGAAASYARVVAGVFVL